MGCCKRKKPTGINKLKSILAGWSSIVWPDKLTEKVAHERAEVCASCSKNKKDWCTDCGCWIPAKARSLSEICDKWMEVDKNNGL